MSYVLRYTVTAATELAAIEQAVSMLRADVRLRGVAGVVRTGHLWTVSLNVWEDA